MVKQYPMLLGGFDSQSGTTAVMMVPATDYDAMSAAFNNLFEQSKRIAAERDSLAAELADKKSEAAHVLTLLADEQDSHAETQVQLAEAERALCAVLLEHDAGGVTLALMGDVRKLVAKVIAGSEP